MLNVDENEFRAHLNKVVAEEDFIERMYKLYGVPRYFTRRLLMNHGISKPVYDALKLAGYSVKDESG